VGRCLRSVGRWPACAFLCGPATQSGPPGPFTRTSDNSEPFTPVRTATAFGTCSQQPNSVCAGAMRCGSCADRLPGPISESRRRAGRARCRPTRRPRPCGRAACARARAVGAAAGSAAGAAVSSQLRPDQRQGEHACVTPDPVTEFRQPCNSRPTEFLSSSCLLST
jgi:hypothetical protein